MGTPPDTVAAHSFIAENAFTLAVCLLPCASLGAKRVSILKVFLLHPNELGHVWDLLTVSLSCYDTTFETFAVDRS